MFYNNGNVGCRNGQKGITLVYESSVNQDGTPAWTSSDFSHESRSVISSVLCTQGPPIIKRWACKSQALCAHTPTHQHTHTHTHAHT